MRRLPLCLLLVPALLAALGPPVAAQTRCAPAGGATIPAPSEVQGDFVFMGRGFGHGVGMSQYGAYGAAKLGCDAAEILTTYYPGTQLSSAPIAEPIRVGLADAAPATQITALTGSLRWETCTAGECAALDEPQPQGATWTASAGPDGGVLLARGEGATAEPAGERLRAVLDGTVARESTTGVRYRWGAIEAQGGAGPDGASLSVVVDIPDFERYLYGLAEMPSSWAPAALQAQAVAGRTYALKRRLAYRGDRAGCRCDVRATVSDQRYTGYEKEAEGEGAVWGRRWVAAVDATAGQVLRYEGALADTFYNSSNGGHSESSGSSSAARSSPISSPSTTAAGSSPRAMTRGARRGRSRSAARRWGRRSGSARSRAWRRRIRRAWPGAWAILRGGPGASASPAPTAASAWPDPTCAAAWACARRCSPSRARRVRPSSRASAARAASRRRRRCRAGGGSPRRKRSSRRRRTSPTRSRPARSRPGSTRPSCSPSPTCCPSLRARSSPGWASTA